MLLKLTMYVTYVINPKNCCIYPSCSNIDRCILANSGLVFKPEQGAPFQWGLEMNQVVSCIHSWRLKSDLYFHAMLQQGSWTRLLHAPMEAFVDRDGNEMFTSVVDGLGSSISSTVTRGHENHGTMIRKGHLDVDPHNGYDETFTFITS